MADRTSIERLQVVLDAYGGDPLHWPQDERFALQALVARDPRAVALITEAESLDSLLDMAPSHLPSPALAARILAQRPTPGLGARLRGLWSDLFPGTATWKPALGFAAALALGTGLQAAAADQLGLNETAEMATADDQSLAPLTGHDFIMDEDTL